MYQVRISLSLFRHISLSYLSALLCLICVSPDPPRMQISIAQPLVPSWRCASSLSSSLSINLCLTGAPTVHSLICMTAAALTSHSCARTMPPHCMPIGVCWRYAVCGSVHSLPLVLKLELLTRSCNVYLLAYFLPLGMADAMKATIHIPDHSRGTC